MKELYKKRKNESQYDYGLRLMLHKVECKPDDLSWEDIVRLTGLECHPDSIRKAFNTTEYSGYSLYRYVTNKVLEENEMFSDAEINELNDRIRELKKERAKLSSEKLEFNRWLRENARDELIVEKVCAAINNVDIIGSIPDLCVCEKECAYELENEDGQSYILAFGDEHFGTEFIIHGLNGEVLNQYSPEIFFARMNELLCEVIKIIRKERIGTLKVMSLGDFCDGILRTSQLFKLRYGVVESTVIYSLFMTKWLNALSKYVNVEFYMTDGNHSELRMLGQPKGTFKDDNMGLVVSTMLRESLKDNDRITFCQNPTGYIYFKASGYDVLGIHGEIKGNYVNAVKDFSNTYRTNIDYVISAHMHHKRSANVGFDKEVISIPSVIGIDDYSVQLNKTSNSGAGLFVFKENDGVCCQYNIKLSMLGNKYKTAEVDISSVI